MFIFFFFNASLVEILRGVRLFFLGFFFLFHFFLYFGVVLPHSPISGKPKDASPLFACRWRRWGGEWGGGEEGEGGCEVMLYRWKGITRSLSALVVHVACFRGAWEGDVFFSCVSGMF